MRRIQQFKISRDDLIDAIGALEIRAHVCLDHANSVFASAQDRKTWLKQSKHFESVAKRLQKALG